MPVKLFKIQDTKYKMSGFQKFKSSLFLSEYKPAME